MQTVRFVVNNQPLSVHIRDEADQSIAAELENCLEQCLVPGHGGLSLENTSIVERTFRLPFLGEIRLGDLSFPVMAVALGALDGFNVCSLGALLLVLSLVLAFKSKKRIVLFGGTFIGVSTLALAEGRVLGVPAAVALLTAGYSAGQIIGPLLVTPLLNNGFHHALLAGAVVVSLAAVVCATVWVIGRKPDTGGADAQIADVAGEGVDDGEPLGEGGAAHRVLERQVERPGADDHLQQHRDVARVGHGLGAQQGTLLDPTRLALGPLHGLLAEHRETCAQILTALVIVRGSGEHAMGLCRLTALHAGMEFRRRVAEAFDVEAYVAAREQPAVAIEGGVLDRLGGDR